MKEMRKQGGALQRRPHVARRPALQSMGRQRQNGSVNPHGMYERYLALAREAASAGDDVQAENCLQHAEHYFRVMRASGRTDR
jgi:hypothetical protein